MYNNDMTGYSVSEVKLKYTRKLYWRAQYTKPTHFRDCGDGWVQTDLAYSDLTIDIDTSSTQLSRENVTLLKPILGSDKESYYPLKIVEKSCCVAVLFRGQKRYFVDE